jgi:Ribosomal L27 protein
MSRLISIRSLLQRGSAGSYATTANLFQPRSIATMLYQSFIAHNTDSSSICDEQRLGGIRGKKTKAAGSTTNGRKSAGRRLGIKVWPNKFASALSVCASVCWLLMNFV